MYTLDKVLKDSVAAHASDIHFTVGCSPFFRIDGMLIPQEGEKLMPKDMEELLLPILDQRHRKELEENGQTDLAYAIRGVGRFRVSIFKQRGTLASVMRCLPFTIPEAKSLGIPEEVQALTQKRRGLVLVTGPTGSGKSTLLRALANIFSADEGSIDLHGHSVSLLAIGVGFKNEMTGRENIMLSGMLLGFSEKEVRERMDEIIDFAGLGKFIDMPVHTYSSGMYSKLAFSITAILETDIMLIDEVLSVGDEKFKKKSYAKMKSLISQRNRTVVIVSHNLKTLEELCDRVMWMHEGKIVKIGEPKEVLQEYREFMK